MNQKKHTFRNLIIFIALIILTFHFIFKNQNFQNIYDIVINANKLYILIAILLMFIYLSLDALNLKRTLSALNEKVSYIKILKISFIGFFFSGITPAASGGQPMQIYYMHKDKVSVANSTLALLINLFSMQVITITMALVSICFNYKALDVGLMIFFIIGIFLNSCALLLLMAGIFSKSLSKSLINFAIKILRKFKLKNINNIEENLEKSLEKYNGSSDYIKSHKELLPRTFIITLVQFLCYYAITYCVYRSLGLVGKNIMQIIGMQSVLFATVSGIPSPGAVGVSEAAYIGIFKTVIPTNMIDSAMLLSRGINFYLFMLISGFIVIINSLFIKRKEEKIEIKEIDE